MSELSTPSVLLVDDDTEWLDSVTVLMGVSQRLRLVGVATRTSEALASCAKLRPDVVLADVRMPGADGLCLTRALTSGDRRRSPKVVVATAFHLDEYLLAALGAGASGFVAKSLAWPEIEDALVVAHHGGIALPAQTSAHLVELVLPGHGELARLTPKETEVLALVGAGHTQCQIAEMLVISQGTVRTHLEHLHSKLGVTTHLELGLIARQAGLGYSTP
jgi:DNA-binding NarL/FixJ family response regulator